jgi:chromosome segregation protein
LLRRWIDERQRDKGAVALLPRHALPRLEALLAEMEFAGQRAAEPVLVGRHERLAALRSRAESARSEVDRQAADRTAAATRLSEAESALRALLATLQDVELELRRTAADETARAGQRGRAEQQLREIEAKRAELERARAEAVKAMDAARTEHSGTEQGLLAHRTSWQQETGSLAEREAAWEAVRDEEAEIRVSHARAEGALSAVERRIQSGRDELTQLKARQVALDEEEGEHRRTLEEIRTLRITAGSELQELFERRDALTSEIRTLEDRLAQSADRAIEMEGRARGLRRTADQASELRHRLELERAESLATERRVRERLEAEWARPFEQLLEEAGPVDGDPELLHAELAAIAADIERLGPINMLAMEEHDEESRRLEFLTAQCDDLIKARDDLQSAIRQINRTARDLFYQTFEQIREKFALTFQTLFEGGECDIRLEDPEDPLETPIDITASPRGKRTQRIHLLSGGERALTALALLFAIYLVKPSPFCVLDEVDAPLDDANISRFIAMLQQFKASTQFIVITHNPRTMESADWLYGVTMEEPGISSIVGVHLDEVLAGVAPAVT